MLDTTSPDEGTAEFLYRKDGQIRYSQNAKQAALSTKEISYTNYDDYSRPRESGVIATSTAFSSLDPDVSSLPSGTNKEQHFTEYDEPDTTGMHAALTASSISTSYYPVQKFVAGNVSKTYTSSSATSTTWYSYDIYGRVEWLVEKIEGLGTKTINYTYDAITGAVTKVDYQKYKSAERFVHKYTYNIADELTKVETSTNDVTYTTQAEYEYYETGSLKRTEIAEDLQGIDYVYNINGQLKAINSPQGSGFKDPGNDAIGTTGFLPDVFGMLIDYHDKDYSRTGTTYNGLKNTSTNDQLNGNIGSVRWHNSTSTPGSSNIDTYKYQYNKNNWLKQADYGVSNASSSVSYAQNGNNDYQVSNITYDANGNIKTLKRNKHYQSGNAMDNLTYTYNSTKKNQLVRVDDAVGAVSGADDIEDQSGTNYIYNQIGQLTDDIKEGYKYYYNASGLVTEVKKNNLSLVKFFYNDRGHRVKKEIYTNGSLTRSDYYVRDVAGSLMALYEGSTLKENPIYGASRLGVHYRSSGANAYQLADHLGNVRAVVIKNGSSALSVTNKTDYYPFGMPMPNRNIEGNYRYGYQGEFAEKEPEIGSGRNSFQLRLYDSRIGRWTSPDPYGEFHSPYLAMGNNPASNVDPSGGCTNKRGEDCVKSVLPGTSYDADGIAWNHDGTDWLGTAIHQDPIYISNASLISTIWNHPATRAITGDKIDLGFSADIFATFIGGEVQFEANWLLRGPDASFLPYISFIPNVGGGLGVGESIGGTFELSKGYFLSSDLSQLTAETLLGPEVAVEAEIGLGLDASAEIAIALDPNRNYAPVWATGTLGVGAGAKVSAGGLFHIMRIHPTKGIIMIGRGGKVVRGEWK